MKKTLIFKIKSFRSKSVRIEKVFPLPLLREALKINLHKAITLCGIVKLSAVRRRVQLAHGLLDLVIKMNRHHGPHYTVKWMKACGTALQKLLGGEKITSLRHIEPNVPLPRLINGFPSFIPKEDRARIHLGHHGITRYWLTLFSLYRIVPLLGKTKINSIYDPFKGDQTTLDHLCDVARLHTRGDLGFKKFIPKNISLIPSSFIVSYSSSPSNTSSFRGILTDWAVITGRFWDCRYAKKLHNNLMSYLALLPNSREKDYFKMKLDRLNFLCDTMPQEVTYSSKSSMVSGNGLSQLACKEEPAGKIRIFAMLDSISQTFLQPLHSTLEQVIRAIPNDATFDQEASVKRSIAKSKASGKAWSFDLSSATDRLPAILTSNIIESILGIPGIGKVWLSILVDRDYSFSPLIKKQYPHLLEDQSNMYRYSVGQPMGGLSSWVGLAITHHFIVQWCHHHLYRYGWCEDYEVLGDDIVIFDEKLAQCYLDVMKGLGVDINLSKSIVSPSKPVFEFAKRTIVDGIRVSPIPFRQLISQVSLGARVADCYTWLQEGLINSNTQLVTLLSKFGKSVATAKAVGMETLALLDLLSRKEILEYKIVIESLIKPQGVIDWSKESISLPLRSSLSLVLNLINGKPDKTYPFSRSDAAFVLSEEIQRILVFCILQNSHRMAHSALEKIWELENSYNFMFVRVGQEKGSFPVLRTPEALKWLQDLKDFWKGSMMKTTGPGISKYVFMGNSDLADTHLLNVKSTLENMINLERVFWNTSLKDALRLHEWVTAHVARNKIPSSVLSRTKYESNVPLLVSLLKLLINNDFLKKLESYKGDPIDLSTVELKNSSMSSPFHVGEQAREWEEVFKALKD